MDRPIQQYPSNGFGVERAGWRDCLTVLQRSDLAVLQQSGLPIFLTQPSRLVAEKEFFTKSFGSTELLCTIRVPDRV
jgi:hypothetical protein